MSTSRGRGLVIGLVAGAFVVLIGGQLLQLGLGLWTLGTGLDGPETTPPAGAGRAVVDEVLDGDTIRVVMDEPAGDLSRGERVRVRLLNVDAPERGGPGASARGGQCGAGEAAAVVEALAPRGSTVHLVTDTEDRDDHGRPLRGVWNARGRFVNAAVVETGWARTMVIEPNDRFHERLVARESVARAQGRGGWARCGWRR